MDGFEAKCDVAVTAKAARPAIRGNHREAALNSCDLTPVFSSQTITIAFISFIG